MRGSMRFEAVHRVTRAFLSVDTRGSMRFESLHRVTIDLAFKTWHLQTEDVVIEEIRRGYWGRRNDLIFLRLWFLFYFCDVFPGTLQGKVPSANIYEVRVLT